LPDADPTITPTLGFIDPRADLMLGAYLVFWHEGIWRIQGLQGSSNVPLMPQSRNSANTRIELSPDGNLVAFSDTPNELSVFNLQTGELISYPNPSLNGVFDIQWLSEGNTLVYTANPREIQIPDDPVGVYGISRSTGETFTLIDPEDKRFAYGLHRLTASKDGRWLAFFAARQTEMLSLDPEYGIYLMDTSCLDRVESCSQSIRLVGDGYEPTWSPDGSLGWVCPDGGESMLCVLNPDAPAPPRIFMTTGDLGWSQDTRFIDFSWSPDGRSIVLTTLSHQSAGSRDVMGDIYLIPASGGPPKRITDSQEVKGSWEGWSPDSRYLVFSQDLGYSEPFGEVGARRPITDLYVYDIQNGKTTDLLNDTDSSEIFGFIMNVE
jgi:Tol biopolymer transport system component